MLKHLKLVPLVVAGVMAVHSVTAIAAEYHYKVPSQKSILGVYPSPHNALVVMFAGGEKEDSTAKILLIDLAASKTIAAPQVEVSDAGSDPVWKKDGSGVLIATTKGVVDLDTLSATHSASIIVSGHAYGLASSEDHSRIAFWLWTKSPMQLVVRSVQTGAFSKKWVLPFDYGSEPYGFQLTFLDENAILARTFDRLDGTALKKFDLATGKIDMIERDAVAVAKSANGAYFIANSKGRTVLKKISNGAVEALTSLSGFDGLHATSTPRWLALTGRGKSAILDTASDRVIASSTCDFMTFLADGTPLYARNGTLSSDATICGHPQRRAR